MKFDRIANTIPYSSACASLVSFPDPPTYLDEKGVW